MYYIQKALDFAQEEVISHPELGRSWNSTEAITLTKESDKLRARWEKCDETDNEEDSEYADTFEQPLTRSFRLQNTAAVQSGYDSIIQNITTAMVKDVNSDHLYGHAQERRI